MTGGGGGEGGGEVWGGLAEVLLELPGVLDGLLLFQLQFLSCRLVVVVEQQVLYSLWVVVGPQQGLLLLGELELEL